MSTAPESLGDLYPHPLIAREGWPFIAVAAVAAAVIGWFAGWVWSIPLWLIVLFVVQFFRDPARTPPRGEGLVISPADGRIVSVERIHDPYLKRESLRLSVFMNVFNVHSNRSPVDGEVREVWYSAGTFLNAALDKASENNERNAIWIRTPDGVDVTCVQIAGLIARRILCYTRAGARLRAGQRFGFIRFGSRVDVYLPLGFQPRARVGDKVYGGLTVLAELEAQRA
ncbi:MAG: phosphatidylserine decarboxylase [Betaproteobacteria bacterium]|nr:MAG: phosphatidylserine decarboxylase [Betaproteobacteria bacterium]